MVNLLKIVDFKNRFNVAWKLFPWVNHFYRKVPESVGEIFHF